MILGNLNRELYDPMGDPFVFNVKENRKMTIARCIATTVSYSGTPTESLTDDEVDRSGAIGRLLSDARRKELDQIEVMSEDITHLRKFGRKALIHPMLFSEFNEELKIAETVSAPTEGMAMSNPKKKNKIIPVKLRGEI